MAKRVVTDSIILKWMGEDQKDENFSFSHESFSSYVYFRYSPIWPLWKNSLLNMTSSADLHRFFSCTCVWESKRERLMFFIADPDNWHYCTEVRWKKIVRLLKSLWSLVMELHWRKKGIQKMWSWFSCFLPCLCLWKSKRVWGQHKAVPCGNVKELMCYVLVLL